MNNEQRAYLLGFFKAGIDVAIDVYNKRSEECAERFFTEITSDMAEEVAKRANLPEDLSSYILHLCDDCCERTDMELAEILYDNIINGDATRFIGYANDILDEWESEETGEETKGGAIMLDRNTKESIINILEYRVRIIKFADTIDDCYLYNIAEMLCITMEYVCFIIEKMETCELDLNDRKNIRRLCKEIYDDLYESGKYRELLETCYDCDCYVLDRNAMGKREEDVISRFVDDFKEEFGKDVCVVEKDKYRVEIRPEQYIKNSNLEIIKQMFFDGSLKIDMDIDGCVDTLACVPKSIIEDAANDVVHGKYIVAAKDGYTVKQCAIINDADNPDDLTESLINMGKKIGINVCGADGLDDVKSMGPIKLVNEGLLLLELSALTDWKC